MLFPGVASWRVALCGSVRGMAAFVDPLSSEYPVGSLRDLLTVVGHLRANLAGRPQEWENPTLETFLAAMEAWLATFPQS